MGILYDMINCKSDILMVYADIDNTEDITKPNNTSGLGEVNAENSNNENKKERV